MGGGGANKPLTNSLNTLNTLKNSNPKELAKNLNKIQSSNLSKESNSKIQDTIKLESIKDSNSIQSKQSKTTITKIGISIVASIVLSQSLVALPSGGKFTHGSGSIKVNGKVMNITGNNTNHIIAWGGGFNINKGESVNFLGNNKSYLNLDYTNKASQILGNLNGNGNNIYLVNPSGVLIGKDASINANKFVASNTIDDITLNNFKTQTKLVESFSPVFKPNKGNIVNLGTIKANNGITLIGDTIDIRGGKIENTSGGTNKDNSIYFVGENIYIDADAVNLSSNNIYATAFKEGYIQRQMKNFQKDRFKFGNFKQLITNESYTYNDNGSITNEQGQNNFKKVITLGNGNADEALSEWYWFANGWNNNNGDTRSVDEFRLVGDIDFSKQIGGKDRTIIDFADSTQNKTYTGNYAAPINNGNGNLVNADYSDAMIVGGYKQKDWMDEKDFFTANFDGGGNTLSNVDIDYHDDSFTSQIGVFGNIREDSSKAQITIKNLIIDGINIDSTVNNSGYIGGFAGYINGGNFSNIILKNIGSISGIGSEGASFGIGGFAGWIDGGTFSNIILSNIESIKAVGGIPKSSPILMVGGFVGQVYDASFSDIVLENFGTISSIIDNERSDGATWSFVGGFAGRNFDKNSFSNIVLNNIGAIRSKFSSDDVGEVIGVYSGGFIGSIESGGGIFSNIILNNIGDIASEIDANNKTTYVGAESFAGGFVGYRELSHSSADINTVASFSNIYLYFNPNATILAEITDRGKGVEGFGKFYGSLSGNTTFDNINLYYNDNPNLGLNNPIKNANSDSKDYYHPTSNPNRQIFLNPYTNETQGKEIFKQALEKQNNSGGAFESNKIVNIGDDSNPIYSFEQTTGSNITPPTDSNTPNIDLGNVALEKDDFISLDSTIKEIIHEILNENYGINIALDKNGYISQETLDKLINISNTIDEILKGIESKESEATLDTKIHKLFELILVDSNPNTAELESLKQSLNFLRAFYDGDNGLKDDFTKWYSKDNSIDKYSYVKDSILKLKSFINGEGSYNKNGLINQISSINNNLKALESLKQRIKAAQKYYQEALEAKLPYETLEGIYNEMVKIIDESYAKAQSLLNTLESEDKVYLTNLLGEYSIKENSGFDDIRGTFSFSGNDILSKIDSIILEDKPALTPPTKEEVGDDPTKENNPDVPNNLQKIADLASKEAILILPAQEKQEAIVEDGKERGRLCIVSDNAKTNNPCMAITY
ncbi:filamentous hemagglutinin family N-terminal domain [Helicobacter pullorum]|uniref:filamentous hemagglutinin N-terminal domain-containing protein n=1 Tax=Helicobacter pullorum TaxID=35818 RepID=UPI000F6EECCA|nr:filamentous hemagglutinin N-terminal domain-containing protein [Helicobacter pullorum]VEJ08105.1 filamentous hemagglutinin family N-terminal domain [Helicobacter pullorum]